MLKYFYIKKKHSKREVISALGIPSGECIIIDAMMFHQKTLLLKDFLQLHNKKY